MVSGSGVISRDAGIWFDAAVTRYVWRDRSGLVKTAVDAFPPDESTPYSRGMLFEKTTPYPGPGFSAYAVRRAAGRGRELSAVAVADWRAKAEQPVQITLGDGSPLQTGTILRVEYTLDVDEMTITARTTDTPAGAWALGPADKTWIATNPVLTWDQFDWSNA
jgi:hypothetical protein